MIKGQFSDRSRFIIKATMKDKRQEGLKELKAEIKKGLWSTPVKMKRNKKGKLVKRN